MFFLPMKGTGQYCGWGQIKIHALASSCFRLLVASMRFGNATVTIIDKGSFMPKRHNTLEAKVGEKNA